jgi:hypothetical protein
MPKRRFRKTEMLQFIEQHFPKGASAKNMAELFWRLELGDVDKHQLAWAGLLKLFQTVLGSKDHQGLPVMIPTRSTDEGGRRWVPLGNANQQECFEYYEECHEGMIADEKALAVLHYYLLQRFGGAPPSVKLTYA